MTSEALIEAVNSLSPEQHDYLKGRRTASSSAFLQAADQFIADHPELLRRLVE
jgi:hypothetical protein